MVLRFLSLIFILVLAFGCSSAKKEEKASFDAGPLARPLLYDFEGLKWGMTKDEVKSVWGAAEEDSWMVLKYADKGGYKRAEALFKSVPPSSNIQTVAGRPAGDEKPFEFLIAVRLTAKDRWDPQETKPKETVRPALIASHGEPLSDPALRKRLYCEADCEIFRLAECTLLEVRWNRAVPEFKMPESVDSLTYRFAPDTLITAVPFAEWEKLRGTVPTSVAPEFKAKIKGFTQGLDGTPVSEIVKLIGPPNLYREEGPGKGRLYYFWLTGSSYSLEIEDGKLRAILYTLYGDDRE